MLTLRISTPLPFRSSPRQQAILFRVPYCALHSPTIIMNYMSLSSSTHGLTPHYHHIPPPSHLHSHGPFSLSTTSGSSSSSSSCSPIRGPIRGSSLTGSGGRHSDLIEDLPVAVPSFLDTAASIHHFPSAFVSHHHHYHHHPLSVATSLGKRSSGNNQNIQCIVCGHGNILYINAQHTLKFLKLMKKKNKIKNIHVCNAYDIMHTYTVSSSPCVNHDLLLCKNNNFGVLKQKNKRKSMDTVNF